MVGAGAGAGAHLAADDCVGHADKQVGTDAGIVAVGLAAWGINFIGIGLALYVFMVDALRVSGRGVDVLRNLFPTAFNWPLFCVALPLMSAPVVQAYRQVSIQLQADPIDYE